MSREVANLAARFEKRGVMAGRVMLLPPDAAVELVEAIRGIGAPVLGVDTFQVATDGVYPLLEHILDLSSGSQDSWSEAITFIRQRQHYGFHFEVVA